jgi:hypothetical protein
MIGPGDLDLACGPTCRRVHPQFFTSTISGSRQSRHGQFMQVYGPHLCEERNPLQQEHIVIIEPAVLNLKLLHEDDDFHVHYLHVHYLIAVT